jgi:hypothetical protein
MNTNLTQMAARCPGAVCLGPAWINNYALVFRHFADIEPEVDSYCDGVLWEITDDNLVALDALEGYPYHYTRFSVCGAILTAGLTLPWFTKWWTNHLSSHPAIITLTQCTKAMSKTMLIHTN